MPRSFVEEIILRSSSINPYNLRWYRLYNSGRRKEKSNLGQFWKTILRLLHATSRSVFQGKKCQNMFSSQCFIIDIDYYRSSQSPRDTLRIPWFEMSAATVMLLGKIPRWLSTIIMIMMMMIRIIVEKCFLPIAAISILPQYFSSTETNWL